MDRRLRILPALVLAVLVSACGYQPRHETPTQAPRPQICDAGVVPAPPDRAAGLRPTVVPPGWNWIAISPEVRALKANDTQADYCVPFAVHVYGTMVGAPTIPMFGAGGNQIVLPYDAILTTPWVGDYLLLAYNPNSERFRNTPPVYELTVIATYQGGTDVFGGGHEMSAFRCALKANGATVVQSLITKPPYTAQCSLKASAFNPY